MKQKIRQCYQFIETVTPCLCFTISFVIGIIGVVFAVYFLRETVCESVQTDMCLSTPGYLFLSYLLSLISLVLAELLFLLIIILMVNCMYGINNWLYKGKIKRCEPLLNYSP